MIQRAIGVTIGALVTFALLWLFADRDFTQQYAIAVVIGALVSFFWPVVIAWWLGRRARDRREDQIEAEVQRQLNEQRRPPS